MRIAIVSDFHGNLAALDAVSADLARQDPDLVIHLGDVAVLGPRPGAVVDRIRELGWPGVLGKLREMAAAFPRPDGTAVSTGEGAAPVTASARAPAAPQRAPLSQRQSRPRKVAR